MGDSFHTLILWPTNRNIGNLAALVDYVRSLPDETNERPPKRARLSIDAQSSVTIIRQEVALIAKSATLSHGASHIEHKDVGRYLRLQKFGQGLCITPQMKSKAVNFETHLPLKLDELSDSLITTLEVTSMQSCNPEMEGCIWAAVDVEILQNGSEVSIKFVVEVNWSESQSVYVPSRLRNKQSALRNRLKAICLPGSDLSSAGGPSPPTMQTFYEAVSIPDMDLPSHQVPRLSAQLYPFQRKSVQWLLNREGVQWGRTTESDEAVLEPYQQDRSVTPISFLPAKDVYGRPFAISPLFDVVAKDPFPSLRFQNIRGGILAEEMGLGKTLEIISLILLHPRPDGTPEVFDPYLGRHLRASKSTLIVTPPSLLDQWLSELRRHAPHLQVMHYPGLPPVASGKRDEKAVITELSCQDVVVTTYDVLRSEVHAAMDPPSRSMRAEQKERAKSPLVQLSWWRVCIDEAQMVESRQSNVALMARLIPRVNAWAITGTPVKDSLQEGSWYLRPNIHVPVGANRS